MKNILIAIVVVVLSNCQTQKTASSNQTNEGMGKRDAAHTSQNALDWDGIYRGLLPCADCEGIQTTISSKKRFDVLSPKQNTSASPTVFTKLLANLAGMKKETPSYLRQADKTSSSQYFVAENYLTQLDIARQQDHRRNCEQVYSHQSQLCHP